ncbi:DUF7305 domain-containing protein [Halomicrobium urmianum]|uniref:DUF7305 domain-containing protein n=1 Tax=Halomicrobium urmianum TaxID=1586233 RepID=UPI001CD94B92|nr:hypothetical protein [Halomicrobium urmianum]
MGRIADTDGDGDDEVTAQPLGRVIYEQGGQTLAYQGGGIFELAAGADDSSVVSAPGFQYQYRNGQQTLSLPLVRIDGDATGSDISLSKTGSQQRGFPSASCLEDDTSDVPDSTVSPEALRNPVQEDYTVKITVRSEFYRAWGTTFERRTDGSVTYDDGDGEVTLERDGSSPPGGGVAAGPITGVMFTGSGSITNVGRIDSYRSDAGGYPTAASFPRRTNGDVVATGTIDLSESPEIGGDLEVGGDFVGTNSFVVHGDATIGGSSDVDNSGEFGGSVSVADAFDMGTGVSNLVTIGDDVIVGGDFVQLHAATVDGSIYVNGALMDNGNDFYVHNSGGIDGSVVASGPIDLNESGAERDAEITGDIVSTGGSVEIGDGVSFDNSDSWSEVHAAGTVYVNDSESTVTYDADVVAGGDVIVESGATVDGDVHASGDVYVYGDVEDDHEVVAGGTVTGESGDGGTPRTPDSPSIPSPRSPDIPSNAPAEDFIDPVRSMEVEPADSDSDSDISDIETWDGCDRSPSNPCTLSAGEYHLDQMRITDGGRLDVETDSGDVDIHVEGGSHGWEMQDGEVNVRGGGEVNITVESEGVNLISNSEINVEDGSQVNVYVNGHPFDVQDTNVDVQDDDARIEVAMDGGDITFGGGAEITTQNDNASQFLVYTMPSARINTNGGASITGVLYGADGSGGGTDYQLTNQVELFGAIVGESDSINTDAKIHFDETLEARTGVGGGGGGGSGSQSERVGFLHVTTTTVTADDA